MLLGVLLCVLGLLLLGVTEQQGRALALGEDALGGPVLTGTAAVPGPDADGELVYAVGAPVLAHPATDAQFGVAVDAPVLLRKVEMFQWKQMTGAQAGYEQDWYDHPIDSTRFAKPDGHANPTQWPLASQRFSADMTVAGFRLSPAIAAMIPGQEPFKPDFSRLPPNMQASFQAQGDALVTSSNPAHPQIGDLRVSWMQVAPAQLSILARDDHGTLVDVRDAAEHQLAEVAVGRMPLDVVLPGAPHPPPFKWARRILSVLLVWAGVVLLLPRARRRDWLLGVAGAAVPLAVVAAGYWFGVRTAAAWILIVLAVLAAVAVAWRWRNVSLTR